MAARKSEAKEIGVAAMLIPLAALGVFLPTVGHGWTGWDDGAYITTSPLMTEPDGLVRIWASTDAEQYYPVTFTTFWLEYRLWERSPSGYHFVNVVIHAVNALLLFLFLHALKVPRWTVWVVTLLFAVHPLQTMSVAWVAQRKNLLSGCFCLLVSLGWIRFRRSGRERWYLASLALFLLALLSKTAVLTYPFALMAMDRMVLKAPVRSTVIRLLPMLALGAFAAMVTVLFEQPFLEDFSPPAVPNRPLIAAAGILFYAGKLLCPVNLVPVYASWDVSLTSVLWWIPVLVLILLLGTVWRARSVRGGLVFFGAVHFVVLLLPSSGLVPFGNIALTYASDHYVYLACIGFFLAIAAGLEGVRVRFPAWAKAVTGIVGVALVAATAATICYTPVFKNARSMWTRTLASNPACFTAHAGLGLFHAGQKDWAEAEKCYRRALELKPGSVNVWLALGTAQLETGNYTAAEDTFQHVAEAHPTLVTPLIKLAFIAERTGRGSRAADLYERVIEIDSEKAETHVRLAKVYLGLSRTDEAARHFGLAVSLNAEDPWAYLGLATCQRGQGEARAAINTLEQGLRIVPGNVSLLNMLARILATAPDDSIRDGMRAVAVAEQACTASYYRDILTLDTLAAAYAEAGDFGKAVATAQAAADLAQKQGYPQTARTIRKCADAYRENKPLREVWTNLVLE